MRRIVVTGVMVVFLLGLSGCGGADLGVPKDAPLPKKKDMTDKLDKIKEMAKTLKTKKSAHGVPGKH